MSPIFQANILVFELKMSKNSVKCSTVAAMLCLNTQLKYSLLHATNKWPIKHYKTDTDKILKLWGMTNI